MVKKPDASPCETPWFDKNINWGRVGAVLVFIGGLGWSGLTAFDAVRLSIVDLKNTNREIQTEMHALATAHDVKMSTSEREMALKIQLEISRLTGVDSRHDETLMQLEKRISNDELISRANQASLLQNIRDMQDVLHSLTRR